MARRGRKICSHPVSAGDRKFEVDIYLDTHTGRFSAKVDGEDLWSYVLSDLRSFIEYQANQPGFDAEYIDISPTIRLFPKPKDKQ